MMLILFIFLAVVILVFLFRFNMRSASRSTIEQPEVEQETATAQEVKEQEMVFEFIHDDKEKPNPTIRKIHTDESLVDDDYRQALRQFQKGRGQKNTTKEEQKNKMDDNQYRNAMLSMKNKKSR